MRAGDAFDGLQGVCRGGGAAMDAGNNIRPEGAASTAPVLEKMPQLTSLDLGGCADSLLGEAFGGWGDLSSVCAVGYALGCDEMWLGYALAGGRCRRRFARCVLRGRGGDGCREFHRA